MVTNAALASYVIEAIIDILIPVICIVILKRKKLLSGKAVGVGVLVFVVGALMIEGGLNATVTHLNPGLVKAPALFAVYGALMAGLFEETGRFIGLRYLLKDSRERKVALSYGAGHGGIEAIVVGALTSIQYLALSVLINQGLFQQSVGSKVPSAMVVKMQETLLHASPAFILLGGVERLFGFLIQVALSLFMLYGIKTKKRLVLLYAILLHALIDFIVGLSQGFHWNPWVTECILMVFAILAAWFITRTRSLFAKP